MAREYHLHLISDATGETLNTVAKAVCAQFEGVTAREHIYSLVRNERQLRRAVEHIAANPGIVFFTLVNPALRQALEAECGRLSVPCVSILDRAVEAMGKFLGSEESHRPGGQHEMDSRYLERVEALNFAIQHDDGQNVQNLAEADVVLVGVSRCSKTPTCIYLAIRGVRAGNIPIVPGVELPEELFALEKPLWSSACGCRRSGCCRSGGPALTPWAKPRVPITSTRIPFAPRSHSHAVCSSAMNGRPSMCRGAPSKRPPLRF